MGKNVPLLVLLRRLPWMLEKLGPADRGRGHHVSFWVSRSRGWWIRSTAGLSHGRTVLCQSRLWASQQTSSMVLAAPRKPRASVPVPRLALSRKY